MKNLWWRLAVAAVVVVVAIVYVMPTINQKIWPHNNINLGLDLQGGMHLVLEVDTQKALENTVERYIQEMRDILRSERIRRVVVDRIDSAKIEIVIHDQDRIDEVKEIIDDEYPDLRMLSSGATGDDYRMVLNLTDKDAAHIQKLSVDQALETIRNRIDQFGVSEPDIRKQGQNRILVQLPGIKDTQRAKDLIGKTALLEFKMVDETGDPASAESTGNIPPGDELLYQVIRDPDTRRERRTPFLVKKRAMLTGAYLTDAEVKIDTQMNEPYVTIRFDRNGAKIFERVTGENVNKRMAIVLDNRVHSAPVIQERIPGGEARITGNFTPEEAHDLAIVLRAGALPAPVNILEERTVGPSLGHDSIRMGIISMIVGMVIVILFMVVYYRGAGLVADFALLLNILLIAGGLAAFKATLTLPGIAGIILTIGMAVDANVLIFERIREEMHRGKTPYASVDSGYERATLTILDANVTTLIAALVLFQFGTGPVKGFAVTLSLGVISSLFTALFVTRLIFDYFLMVRKVRTISI